MLSGANVGRVTSRVEAAQFARGLAEKIQKRPTVPSEYGFNIKYLQIENIATEFHFATGQNDIDVQT
ncbi:hypothetical protein LSAT2_000443 [Lamellibrachia satsuma]|nr:hypothetical protein LSAT2_000443 [Lamellibrachia satsuma]